MPQHLTHHFWVDTRPQEQCGRRVPQIVKADLRHAGALDHAVKAAAHHVGGLDRPAYLTGEDGAPISPRQTECVTLSLLTQEMRLESIDDIRRKRNAPATMFGLGLLKDKAFPYLVAQRCPNLECSMRQIDILPAKRKQLTLAHASGEREHIDGMQPLTPTRLQEGARLQIGRASCRERG